MALHVVTIGDGAMATVCSQVVAAKADSVRLWGRDPARLADFERRRENTRYLPGVALPATLHFTGDDATLFDACDLIIAAVPVQYLRAALERLKRYIPPGVPIVNVAKGIEIGTLKRPSEIIADVLGDSHAPPARSIAALSGPSIAGELARGLPATMVVAAAPAGPLFDTPPAAPSAAPLPAHFDTPPAAPSVASFDTPSATPSATAPSNPIPAPSNPTAQTQGPAQTQAAARTETFLKWIQELFTTPYLRIYRNEDLIGVELAGALKNVIAVAAGMLDGMHAGNNAKAALLTRGLVEITRFGTALGARPDTFTGLAGLGDLVTTCVSPEGRNRTFGERVGRGEKVAAVLADMIGVVEGVPTCQAVTTLAQQKQIDMPLCTALHTVLFENRNPRQAIAELMSRESKSE